MINNDSFKLINFGVYIEFSTGGDVNIDLNDIKTCMWLEDIFLYGSIGRLTIIDKYGLKELGPLEGDEKIVISYGNDEIIERTFYIVKINKNYTASTVNSGNIFVTDLIFAEKHLENVSLKRFSKSWVNKKYSEIVDDIAKNMIGIDKFDNFEETCETLENFIMPFWTPGEALTWLMRRCSSKVTRTPGYVLYTSQGKFNFVTIESLLRKKKAENENYLFECENLFYANKIISWDHSGVDRTTLRDIAGTTRMGFDPYTKKLVFSKNKYSDSVQKFTSLGRRALFKNDIDNITSSYSLEGDANTSILANIHYNDFIKNYINQNTFMPVVIGNEKRYPGMIIEVEWPSSVDEIFNKMMSGLYLVRGITSHFSNETIPTFLQKMVCCKTGYEDIDSIKLSKPKLKNLSGIL